MFTQEATVDRWPLLDLINKLNLTSSMTFEQHKNGFLQKRKSGS